MPKRTNDFQSLITHIYEQIVPEGGSVTESGMVFDKEAKILREVDILVEYKYAGHEFNFIVECRDRSRRETVEWIDSLVGKTQSLKVNKVIAVSSSGFAAAATNKAKENNIETLTLEEANDTHWGEFPIRPGIVVFTDDTYRIDDVLYKNGDQYISLATLGLDRDIDCNGEIVGNLKATVELFFKEYVVKQIDQHKKDNFSDIFKTKADTEKLMVVESEYTWPEFSVSDNDGRRITISKVKYIVVGTRQAMDVKQEHKVLNDKVVSFGQHENSDLSKINFKIVQDPDTRKMHFNWTKEQTDENA